MSKEITFNNTAYSQDSLTEMSIEDLLTLRNLVASNLGVASVKSFKDKAAAETQTWKALERFDSQDGEEEPKVKKPKVKKEPKPRGLAKSAEAKTVKRPTKKMFAKIKKIGEHDGTQGRAHRWPNYKDGMTLVDVIETEGTEPWDVYSWVEAGIMEVTEPTDEEFAERKATWYKKHGLTDPEEAKRIRAEERAKAKAEREKAAAEKKAAREKAAAEKAAAAEKSGK
jgi:colicin import membrane protein